MVYRDFRLVPPPAPWDSYLPSTSILSVHLPLLVHPLFSSTVSRQCWRGPRGQGGVDNQAGGLNSRLDRRDSILTRPLIPASKSTTPLAYFLLEAPFPLTDDLRPAARQGLQILRTIAAQQPGSKSSRLVDQPDTYRPPKTSNKLTLTYPIPELRRPPLFHRTVSSRLPSSRTITSLAPHDSTCRLDLVPRLQLRTSRSGDYEVWSSTALQRFGLSYRCLLTPHAVVFVLRCVIGPTRPVLFGLTLTAPTTLPTEPDQLQVLSQIFHPS
jgi:hypothetical protein